MKTEKSGSLCHRKNCRLYLRCTCKEEGMNCPVKTMARQTSRISHSMDSLISMSVPETLDYFLCCRCWKILFSRFFPDCFRFLCSIEIPAGRRFRTEFCLSVSPVYSGSEAYSLLIFIDLSSGPVQAEQSPGFAMFGRGAQKHSAAGR